MYLKQIIIWLFARSGRSLGTADIVYERKSDAIKGKILKTTFGGIISSSMMNLRTDIRAGVGSLSCPNLPCRQTWSLWSNHNWTRPSQQNWNLSHNFLGRDLSDQNNSSNETVWWSSTGWAGDEDRDGSWSCSGTIIGANFCAIFWNFFLLSIEDDFLLISFDKDWILTGGWQCTDKSHSKAADQVS